jgi:type VII secretion protein EccB
MTTTREQAEAYAYENRRRITSLVRGADEATLDPRRRLNRAVGGGVAIGILIMAGFGIAGWLGGGRGPDLPGSGAVLASGSGDRYVVSDGVVHPALNLASALLVGGGETTTVKQGTIDDAPRGLPVGIPGAPDALPGDDELLDADWTVCATPSETGGDPTQTVLYVSVPGIAPAAAASADAPAGGSTVLAQAEDGQLWLLTAGRRYAVEPAIGDILGLQGVEPVRLPRTILATVPEGPEIVIPDQGGDVGDAPEATLPFEAAVGDLVSTGVEGPNPRNPQYYVVRPAGLAPVSELVHTLLGATDVEDHQVGASDAAQAPRSDARPPGDPAWPETSPIAEEPGRNQPVCVSTPPGGQPGDTPWQSTVHLPETMPQPEDLTPVRATSGERLGTVDEIYLPVGSGALVRATTSSGTGGTYTLVTDSGVAYPFASPDAVERLGYQPADAPSLPSGFARLLPAGPLLDPDAAAREQTGGTIAEGEQ